MNTTKATQIAKSLGYGNVFVRSNGEICLNNKSDKVILTLNPDFTVKFSRFNMTNEVQAIKEAMINSNQVNNLGTNKAPEVNSGSGFAMADTSRNWDLVSEYGYDAIEMTN